MAIVIRRKDSFRKQLLAVILLSILAGIVGGAMVGLSTSHHPVAQGQQ
jgi:heme A synthase